MKRKFRFYSLWLSLICIIVFIFQNLIAGFTELFVLNEKVFLGEIWRFVSAIFLHGGVGHLLYNLFALLFFGFALEKLIGSRKFLIIFFGTGIIANIISVNFYFSSLGASGAIMGIIGVMAVIRPMMMVWAFGLILPMFLAAILWIIGDIMRGVGIFGETNIGSIAHLSGVGVGILVGIFLRGKRIKGKKRIKISEVYMRSWEDRFMRN